MPWGKQSWSGKSPAEQAFRLQRRCEVQADSRQQARQQPERVQGSLHFFPLLWQTPNTTLPASRRAPSARGVVDRLQCKGDRSGFRQASGALEPLVFSDAGSRHRLFAPCVWFALANTRRTVRTRNIRDMTGVPGVWGTCLSKTALRCCSSGNLQRRRCDYPGGSGRRQSVKSDRRYPFRVTCP
jgi:hypothetical protein